MQYNCVCSDGGQTLANLLVILHLSVLCMNLFKTLIRITELFEPLNNLKYKHSCRPDGIPFFCYLIDPFRPETFMMLGN